MGLMFEKKQKKDNVSIKIKYTNLLKNIYNYFFHQDLLDRS